MPPLGQIRHAAERKMPYHPCSPATLERFNTAGSIVFTNFWTGFTLSVFANIATALLYNPSLPSPHHLHRTATTSAANQTILYCAVLHLLIKGMRSEIVDDSRTTGSWVVVVPRPSGRILVLCVSTLAGLTPDIEILAQHARVVALGLVEVAVLAQEAPDTQRMVLACHLCHHIEAVTLSQGEADG